MKKSLFSFVFSVVAGSALANPCSADDRTLQFPMQHYAGHFREHCMTLSSGQTLEMTVRTLHPVKANIHYHTRDTTHFLFNRMFSNAESESVTSEAGGEYCIEVTNVENREAAFEVQLELELTAD